jgi:glycosyltransferase involved in cell wall biosynthesis
MNNTSINRKIINIHLYPSSFQNESRIEKIAHSIEKCKIFTDIVLIGTKESGIEPTRKIGKNIEIKLFGISNLNYGIFYKMFVFVFWYVSILKYLLFRPIKCINVHSLSSLPLGVICKILKGSVLIYDTHELETETISQSGFRKKFAKFIEKKLIAFSDHVFVVSESIATWYKEQYSIKRPSVILNVPSLTKQQKFNIFREKFPINSNQKILIYQGDLSYGRGVEILLNVFLKRDHNNCVVVFMGNGDLREKIIKASNKSNIIFFHDFVNPKNVYKYTASADIGVALIENACLSYYYCLPNKLFEYAMSGLPVIVSNVYEMAKLVESAKNGVVTKCIGEECFEAAIKDILNKNLTELSLNSRKIAEKNSWDIQEKKLYEIYKKQLFN